jgi:haloalkane dehalogenase
MTELINADRAFTEVWAQRGRHRIRVRDYPGAGPAIMLMHGFPDNLHLYDRLLPHLHRRRVVTFDFLGWGGSDKPAGYAYTAASQVGDVDAVLSRLEIDRVVLVAHDSSGPPAIDWALEHPDRVAALVLLNTYYGWTPRLRRPEAIVLFSTPLLRNLARALIRRSDRLDRRLYAWQVGRFVRDDAVRNEVVPALYAQFRAARPAFWRLNDDLLPTVFDRTRRRRRLRAFPAPVRIVFGADDPYLNTGVARSFHRLFPRSDLHLLPRARHYVQIDEPAEVARLILTAAQGGPDNGGIAGPRVARPQTPDR